MSTFVKLGTVIAFAESANISPHKAVVIDITDGYKGITLAVNYSSRPLRTDSINDEWVPRKAHLGQIKDVWEDFESAIRERNADEEGGRKEFHKLRMGMTVIRDHLKHLGVDHEMGISTFTLSVDAMEKLLSKCKQG